MCLCVSEKLTLKIPWKNLYNDAVVATLDGLYLLVVPGASKSPFSGLCLVFGLHGTDSAVSLDTVSAPHVDQVETLLWPLIQDMGSDYKTT